MQTFKRIVVAASLIVSSSLMAENATISAKKINADLSHISYSSTLWQNATFSDVTLYPQTTITLNDKKANEANANAKAQVAKVAALYNDTTIAFIIKWADGTVNIQQGYKTDSYGDGFAVQFAGDYSKADALPYIGMGSESRYVVVHLQKAAKGIYEADGNGNVYNQQNPQQTALFNSKLNHDLASFDKKVKSLGSNDYERSFVSEGFRSMTEIKDGSNQSYSRIGYANGGWKGTLSRPLKDEYVNLNAGAIPVAFAVWDGAKMGRDGIKNLSSWVSVKLEGNSGGDALIDALSTDSVGDAVAGKEAVATNGCRGCHQVESTDNKNLMAPALYNIGGYSTSGYLRESLLHPSAVVVPGYNRNAHSNYMWYTDENGKRTSTMTDYSFLDEKTLNDIVAYLQTLKVEVK